MRVVVIFVLVTMLVVACSPSPAPLPTATGKSEPTIAPTSAPTSTPPVTIPPSPPPTGTRAPQPTVTQTSAPPTPSLGTLLFSDDFTNPNSGWSLIASPNNSFSYQRDGFHIVVNKTGAFIGLEPSPYKLDINNYAVQVDIKQISGGSACSGEFFRAHPGFTSATGEVEWNLYLFDVCPTGVFRVRKLNSGDPKRNITVGDIQVVKDTPSTAIKKGNENNRLLVVARESQFNLYINGIQVGTLTDDSYPTGNVGLRGGAQQNVAAEFVFQNFMIWSLP